MFFFNDQAVFLVKLVGFTQSLQYNVYILVLL